MSGRQCTTGLVKQFFPGEVKPGLDPNPQVTPASQRVCMRVAGGKEYGVNEDFAGQSSANFLSSAA